MSDIRIITDSACDIPDDRLAACPEIVMLNIPMVVDGQPRRERKDFSIREYYTVLEQAKELPTTSQITMMEFCEAYKTALEDGVRHLVVVTITGKASNMYNSACMARDALWEERPEARGAMTIDVVDSRTYTVLYGTAILEAVDMIRAGADYTRVVQHLSTIPERVDVSFTIFNLDYAKRSGRISFAAAFVGELLGLRPIMSIIDGAVASTGKVRGDRQAIQKLVSLYEQAAAGAADYPYILLQGGRDDYYEELRQAMLARKHKNVQGHYYIGASVTTNAGPTLVGVIYPRKKA